MGSLPNHPLGGSDRPLYPETGRLHPGTPASSGAGIPVVSGAASSGENLSSERLEAACFRALEIKAYSYKNVESILKKGLDQQPSPLASSQRRLPLLIHENLRGKQYYQ